MAQYLRSQNNHVRKTTETNKVSPIQETTQCNKIGVKPHNATTRERERDRERERERERERVKTNILKLLLLS
jgi:hypothetical protein